MDIFVGRQPIYNHKEETVAYELLYRSNNKNNNYNRSDVSLDENNATLNVIMNGFITMGLNNVAENKPAFVNFTEDLLNNEIIYMLPPDNIIIEILETINPSHEIIKRCNELKKSGYKLALDDFLFDEKYTDLIKLADIIKIDFLITKGTERFEVIKKLKSINNSLIFLAEKVETYQDFKQAKDFGYSLFQGYYFSKPVILSSKDIPIAKFNYLNLMSEIGKKDSNLDSLKKIIISDVSLSYKLLKLINSPYFGLRRKIKSIDEAVAIIGENNLKCWLNTIIIQDLGKGSSLELLKNSLIRAKFAELLSLNTNLKDRSFDTYMMGMISMIDCLLNRPLDELLQDLFISNDIKEALLEKEKNSFYYLYKLICSYEKGKWDEVVLLSRRLDIDTKDILNLYGQSIEWAISTISS